MRTLNLWILAALIFLSYAVVLMPILWLRPQNLIHGAVRSWSLLVCRIAGLNINVRRAGELSAEDGDASGLAPANAGAGITDAHGPLVVISNHLSLFDMLVMYHSFPQLQFRWLAKASLFKIPVWGWGMWGAGYIPVERDNRRSARGSMEAAAEQVRGGKSVIVFAEGTRGPGGANMLPFKRGGFVLAKRAGVAIQPMTILDSDRMIPKRKGQLLQPIHQGTVHVVLHPPIPPAEVEAATPEAMRDRCRAIIGGAFASHPAH